ncbi:hypothetical protein S7335_4908 [Synechococcus sp. PCC 7335]|nr:hypothetical protein S7335_4908 [Synechococcus sp. PCC 7335]
MKHRYPYLACALTNLHANQPAQNQKIPTALSDQARGSSAAGAFARLL